MFFVVVLENGKGDSGPTPDVTTPLGFALELMTPTFSYAMLCLCTGLGPKAPVIVSILLTGCESWKIMMNHDDRIEV